MTDGYPMYVTRRDVPVINELTPGETYGVTHLTNLYKTRTDITQDSTAKQRMKNLVQSPAFEYVATGRFRYVGVNHE